MAILSPVNRMIQSSMICRFCGSVGHTPFQLGTSEHPIEMATSNKEFTIQVMVLGGFTRAKAWPILDTLQTNKFLAGERR